MFPLFTTKKIPTTTAIPLISFVLFYRCYFFEYDNPCFFLLGSEIGRKSRSVFLKNQRKQNPIADMIVCVPGWCFCLVLLLDFSTSKRCIKWKAWAVRCATSNNLMAIHFTLSATRSENLLFQNPVPILWWYNQNIVFQIRMCVFVVRAWVTCLSAILVWLCIEGVPKYQF